MRPLLRLIGILVHIPGIMAVVSLLVAGFHFNQNDNLALLITAVTSLTLGQLAFRCGVKMDRNEKHLATPAVAVSWFVVPWICAIPFWLIGAWNPAAAQGLGDLASGLFESMSGLTSCGLTVSGDTSQLSPMLQWWRSLSQWVGGLGMAVFALLLIVPQEDGEAFLGAEGLTQTFGDTPKKTVIYIVQFYTAFTALALLLFWLTGMPVWDAINNSLTVISTGGFTMNGVGFQAYSRSSQWVAVLFMILGAISFRIYYLLIVKREFKQIWQSSELRLYAIILLVGGSLSVSGLAFTLSEKRFSDLVFQWVSAAGTCGFATAEVKDWGSPSLMILIAVMVVGGMTGSTAGGIKVTRLLWLLKGARTHLKRMMASEPEFDFFWNGEFLSDENANARIRSAAVLFAVWFASLFLGTLATIYLVGDEFGFLHVAFEVTSALSGVGLSTDVISGNSPESIQWLFILLMWLGRLEIFTVIGLFFLGGNKFLSLFHIAGHKDEKRGRS